MNRTQSLTPAQAKSLLSTFKNPQRAEVPADGFAGQFLSNRDFMSAPYVVGGYVKGDDHTSEISIGWEGIEGLEDVTDLMSGYAFTTDKLRNWEEAVRETKAHLQSIIDD